MRAAIRCEALQIWQGGLGIWGAIALGAVGAWIGARRRGVPLPAARRRAGARHRRSPRRSAGGATGSTRSCSAARPTCRGRWRSTRSSGRQRFADVETFHPTFLYESLWCIGVALRPDLGRPAVPAWATAGCSPCTSRSTRSGAAGSSTCGSIPRREILGLRLNVWTSILVFAGRSSTSSYPPGGTPAVRHLPNSAGHRTNQRPSPARRSSHPVVVPMPPTSPDRRATSQPWRVQTTAPTRNVHTAARGTGRVGASSHTARSGKPHHRCSVVTGLVASGHDRRDGGSGPRACRRHRRVAAPGRIRRHGRAGVELRPHRRSRRRQRRPAV